MWLRPVALLVFVSACSPAPAPSLAVWYDAERMVADRPELTVAEAERPELLVGWRNWEPRSDWAIVDANGRRWRRIQFSLPPGRYQYALLVGETVVPDPLVPASAFVKDPLGRDEDPYGVEVSEVELTAPGLSVGEVSAGSSMLEVSLEGARGALAATLQRGSDDMAAPAIDGTRVMASGLQPGKYTLSVDDASGAQASASAFVGDPEPRTLEDGLVYQIMVDRFRGPAGALSAPDTPGDRAGGTLDGVRAAVEAGYFAQLGVTTLWLSPLYQNPTGKHVGRDGRLYEAYHGYWPAEPRTVEPLFGGEAALDALVGSAHARGLRVIMDAVPNHVYQSHPYFAAHSRKVVGDASWFNDGPTACVCGDPGCDWGTYIESCWFGPELPDLNWRDPDVVAAGTDDLLWWMKRFDLDGLRIDAVPMMPRAATRRIAHAVRAQVARRGLDGLLLGEDYTGAGDPGREEIRAYLDQRLDGLDSAFDFPLMWATRRTVAHSDAGFGFDALEREVQAGQAAWTGSGATVAHMLDNHDTTRFSSESAGDAGGDPWLQPPAQSQDPSVYARQFVGIAFVMTLPGLPVLYYGDELALAGATDPDSRRVLPDVLAPSTLPPLEGELLSKVSKLGRARQCSRDLRRGERTVLFADAEHHVSLRGQALVVLSRASAPSTLRLPKLPIGRYRDVVSGALMVLAPGDALPVAPATAAVWLPLGDRCLSDGD